MEHSASRIEECWLGRTVPRNNQHGNRIKQYLVDIFFFNFLSFCNQPRMNKD